MKVNSERGACLCCKGSGRRAIWGVDAGGNDVQMDAGRCICCDGEGTAYLGSEVGLGGCRGYHRSEVHHPPKNRSCRCSCHSTDDRPRRD